MSIYRLKPYFQTLLRPCVKLLAFLGVTANQVTIFAALISVTAAATLFALGESPYWFWLPVILFVRMALNAIDGMLAREHHMQSVLGGVLNELGDLIADAAIYLSFIAISGFSATMLFIFVLLSWLSEIIAILAAQHTDSRPNHGPLGKSDRATLFSILAILVGFNVDLTAWGDGVIAIACLALLVTSYRRLRTII
ncbi:CDP-alcohol phosphatidyltransferase family protein [Vibrio profundum]|uniref:CDP-alcohol phosphatidyltransferase family protein n=1 Tax=Vibrio profundum TaxID=2910247 RepID=UPI003D10AE5A